MLKINYMTLLPNQVPKKVMYSAFAGKKVIVDAHKRITVRIGKRLKEL